MFEEEEEEKDDKPCGAEEFKLTGLEREDENENYLDKVDVALKPARDAARSFAESVMIEEKKQKEVGPSKTQVY